MDYAPSLRPNLRHNAKKATSPRNSYILPFPLMVRLYCYHPHASDGGGRRYSYRWSLDSKKQVDHYRLR